MIKSVDQIISFNLQTMSNGRKSGNYRIEIRKDSLLDELFDGTPVPTCNSCSGELVLDWKTSVVKHKPPDPSAPSACKVVFPKRGRKFKYETVGEAKEAKAVKTRALVKRIREKGKEGKRKAKERLDKFNAKRSAERAAIASPTPHQSRA